MAAAQSGKILGESYWARDESLEDMLKFSEGLERKFPNDREVANFVDMLELAADLDR